MKRFLSNHLDDLLLVAGAALIVAGASILSMVAALFTAGVFLIAFGILIGLGNRSKSA